MPFFNKKLLTNCYLKDVINLFTTGSAWECSVYRGHGHHGAETFCHRKLVLRGPKMVNTKKGVIGREGKDRQGEEKTKNTQHI